MAFHSIVATPVTEPVREARSFEIVHWPLPAFTGPSLERLYHSTFCSLPHLHIHGSIGSSTQAWVERRSGEITALLLFDVRQGCARVINEVIDLDVETLKYFVQTMFRHYAGVTAIALRAVTVATPSLPYYFQIADSSEDFVLDLPDSEAAYLSSLKRQTQEKIRYYQKRSRRKQPSLVFRTARGSSINTADVNGVIAFSRARMVSKGRQFAMDDQEQQRLQSLMQACGFVAVIEIDAQVRAGLLCTQTGRDMYLHVIAHDPRHDDLNLGFLCCYLGIKSAIEQGCLRFHFLWGRSDYKPRFGAKPKPLRSMTLYKSRLHILMHPRLFLEQIKKAARHELKTWRHRWQVFRARQSRPNKTA